MYDTGMPEGYNADGVYTGFDNISDNFGYCGYSWMDNFDIEEHKMPGLSLAEYIEQGVLRVPETLLYKFI